MNECPEFLTWKVGNPTEATNFKFGVLIDYKECYWKMQK